VLSDLRRLSLASVEPPVFFIGWRGGADPQATCKLCLILKIIYIIYIMFRDSMS